MALTARVLLLSLLSVASQHQLRIVGQEGRGADLPSTMASTERVRLHRDATAAAATAETPTERAARLHQLHKQSVDVRGANYKAALDCDSETVVEHYAEMVS